MVFLDMSEDSVKGPGCVALYDVLLRVRRIYMNV